MDSRMSDRVVVTINTINENGDILSSKELSNKEITEPTNINNFGYNKDEQLEMMKGLQEILLNNQAVFLK
jgi:hypothetical protein